MALTRNQKKAQVQELTDQLGRAASVMFAHYIGLNVAEVSELRNTLKENDAEMRVAKKTLLKLAAKNADTPALDDFILEGPVSCIFSYADPLSGAQIAFKFGKTHQQVALVGGIFEGKVLSKEEVIELAQLPGRDVLLATFVSMVRSPLYSFANMCNTPLTGFARALSEIAEKGGVHAAGEEPKEEQNVEEAAETATDQTTEEEKPAEAAEAADAPETTS